MLFEEACFSADCDICL